MPGISQSGLFEGQLGRQAMYSYVVAVSGSAAVKINTSRLPDGIHTMGTTVAIWFRQGPSDVEAKIATNGSRYLPAGGEYDVLVNSSKAAYMSVIAVGISGHVYIGPNRNGL